MGLRAAARRSKIQLTGWFVPPRSAGIRGLRAHFRRKLFVARRKKMRPEVLAEHPGRKEALFSGFSIDIRLASGWNDFDLQYKDEEGRWHTFTRCEIYLSPLWWLKRLPPPSPKIDSHHGWSRDLGDPPPEELEAMTRFLDHFPVTPRISILMPTHNPPLRWLNRAIESVLAQVYPHWELCIADDASEDPEVLSTLQSWAVRDPRIKVRPLPKRGHICRTSNAALELATGEFVALFDHDDELPPHALFHVAWEIAQNEELDLVFSDEDKIDEHGIRSGPYFKTGWNYDLLLGQNCVSHLGVFRAEKMRQLGGFRVGYEGSQDWDLTLRFAESCAPENICHVPRILYHWRILPESASSGPEAKPYAVSAGMRAVEDHLERAGTRARLHQRHLREGSHWQITWPLPDPPPLVSLVISEPGPVSSFIRSLDSLKSTPALPPFEIVAVTEDPDHADLRSPHADLRVTPPPASNTGAARAHQGALAARGEVIVFLDRSLEVPPSATDWLRELTTQALRPDVGAVGACLLQPDGTIHHAGLVLQMTNLVGHVFRYSPTEACSAGGPPNLPREVTAVSATGMAIRRSTYFEVGGFDREKVSRIYFDVDLCLRLREAGLRNMFTPISRLSYFEEVSPRVHEDQIAKSEAEEIITRWSLEFAKDPFFNPNLSPHSEIPVASVPRTTWPWQRHQPVAQPPLGSESFQLF